MHSALLAFALMACTYASNVVEVALDSEKYNTLVPDAPPGFENSPTMDRLQRVLKAKGLRPYPRISLGPDGKGTAEGLAKLKHHLSMNIPVILTDHQLWDDASFIDGLVEKVLNRWQQTQGPERVQRYMDGEGRGSCGQHFQDTKRWHWPWHGDVTFTTSSCGAFGAYASPEKTDQYINKLENNGISWRSISGLHFDNVCGFATAVQMTGAKMYWTQNPDYTLLNADAPGAVSPQQVAGWLNDYYEENKMTAFMSPADSPLQDRADILLPGQIIVFPYWMPHIAVPLDGHSLTLNGPTTFLDSADSSDLNPISVAQPLHLQKLCRAQKEVGIHTGNSPQVQPWDEEWEVMVDNLKQCTGLRQRSVCTQNALDTAIEDYRNRACNELREGPGKYRMYKGNAYRDPRCLEREAAASQ